MNMVIVCSERTTLLLEFVGPIEAAGLRIFVDGVHHAFVCFEGFVGFTSCSKQQGREIPAEDLDKTFSYEKR